MNLLSIFLNSFGRLRSGWRFLIFVIVFVLTLKISSPLNYVFEPIREIFPKDDLTSTGFSYFSNNFLPFLGAIFVGWLCGKFLEGLPFRALGCWFTKNWFKDLALGLGLGTVSILFAALVSMIFGGSSFQINQTIDSKTILATLGTSLIVFIMGAASEEAIFRGYILQNFARAKLIWFGISLTCLFFALVHAGNPNVTVFSLINTALAGIWFGVAYFKTRNLWFPFGIHLMWNWVQGAFLGIPVSGIIDITPNPILQRIDTGPTWLTGGHYGIEGGFACTAALVLSTLLIWFLPIFKPTEEMLALTDQENPKAESLV